MQNIVIDTNVLVSALISPSGTSGKVLESIFVNENVCICYSDDIIDEYNKVLNMGHFKRYNFDTKRKKQIILDIVKLGQKTTPIISKTRLPDEDDRIFYDAAKASDSIILTWNKKHFPKKSSTLTPTEYMNKRTKIREKLL